MTEPISRDLDFNWTQYLYYILIVITPSQREVVWRYMFESSALKRVMYTGETPSNAHGFREPPKGRPPRLRPCDVDIMLHPSFVE